MKTYNIIVLGASGSGKTIFLSSMFHKLSVQRKEVGFYLEAESPKQRRILTKKYAELADPSKDWPPGTRRNEVSEWTFTCVVSSPESSYPVFRFRYWDYAGGHLTEPGHDGKVKSGTAEAAFDIDQRAKDSDAVLVLLDGQKVLHLMDGTTHPTLPSLGDDLDQILPVVQQVLRANPLQFMISKWDLLDGRYKMQAIRDRLLAHDKFRAIVDQRRAHKTPTRIIPTSALGSGFVHLGPNGEMQKTADSRPMPFQVEMPMACALIDGFHTAQQAIERRQNDPRHMFRKLGIGALRLLGEMGAPAAAVLAMLLPIQFRLGQGAIAILNDAVGNKLGRRVARLDRTHLERLAAVRDHRSAIESALHSYSFIMGKLDQAFPHADLHRV